MKVVMYDDRVRIVDTIAINSKKHSKKVIILVFNGLYCRLIHY